MTFLSNLFSKKKASLATRCAITGERIERGFGYLLTTAQIVVSRKYWDMIMTEPEALAYSIAHFGNQENGTHMRNLLFEKYSSQEKAWMISEAVISLFDQVDRCAAQQYAQAWWDADGQFEPENTGPALESLTPEEYQEVKEYAVLEAGRERLMSRAALTLTL